MKRLNYLMFALGLCVVSFLNVTDASAQKRGMASEEGNFYVAFRGAYPATSITSIGGSGILAFGYRADSMFRTELELAYGSVTVEVDESGVAPIPNPAAPGMLLASPQIPVEFEADNTTFLVFGNAYFDIPLDESWRVTPYLGVSLGYINVDTTPDYGNAEDVAGVAAAVEKALVGIPLPPGASDAITTGIVQGVRSSIPVGTLQAVGYGAMVGMSIDVGYNLFVDLGYRYMAVSKDLKNWHEARAGIAYNWH